MYSYVNNEVEAGVARDARLHAVIDERFATLLPSCQPEGDTTDSFVTAAPNTNQLCSLYELLNGQAKQIQVASQELGATGVGQQALRSSEGLTGLHRFFYRVSQGYAQGEQSKVTCGNIILVVWW